MSADQLCALDGCRILHFMIHDRISFGGVLVAEGVLYLWLAMFPMRRFESWAWWGLALSGLAGFLSFLAYLGYGYLDTWHGAGTLALLPLFGAGLFLARGLRRERVAPAAVDLRSAAGAGRALLLLSSTGIATAGLTIMTVGMTRVFVPQDLEFMRTTREAVGAINLHLVPLIAHDRAGFGGALVSFGGGDVCVRPLRRAVARVVAGARDRRRRRVRCRDRRAPRRRLPERVASRPRGLRLPRVRRRSDARGSFVSRLKMRPGADLAPVIARSAI